MAAIALAPPLLRRHPTLIPCVMAATLLSTGDTIAQQFAEHKGMDHDLARTARMAAYGGLFFAPVAVQWYRILGRIQLKSRPVTVATQVVADQTIFAPAMLAAFFTATSLMEGKSIDDVKHKLRTKYTPTLAANWVVYVPFQSLNMAFTPAPFRLLGVNVFSLFWNSYLSLASPSAVVRRLEEAPKKEEVMLHQVLG